MTRTRGSGMERKTIFVTGGARSGKSRFALAEASKIAGQRAYIATAWAGDEEMRRRIEDHRKQRKQGWTTHEEPLRIVSLLETIKEDCSVILIDCLTLWLSNLMQAGMDVQAETDRLVSVLRVQHPPVYIVSNEVGMGIVPGNVMTRTFRDMAGYVNQEIAAVADEVYITVAGIPLKIKGDNR
jgi:adenosylcobinamide kinase/adenosylcobinamide-phosphate guanylyltransferase